VYQSILGKPVRFIIDWVEREIIITDLEPASGRGPGVNFLAPNCYGGLWVDIYKSSLIFHGALGNVI
jgi:hypothetical protein